MRKVTQKIVVALALLMLASEVSAQVEIDTCTLINQPGVYVLNQDIMNSPGDRCISIYSDDVIFNRDIPLMD